jgi:PKD repeat protein
MDCLKRLIFLTLFIIIGAVPLYAAPAISPSTPTSITHGASFTITGTSLMNEDKANWLSMFRSGNAYGFEGSSYAADGYMLAPDDMTYGTGGYDASVKLSGSKSIYGNVTAATKTGYGYYTNPSGTDLYIRFYTRWHSSGAWKWPDSYCKMTMVGGGDQMYLQPLASGASALPTRMVMQYGGEPHDYAVSNFLTDNRWYCIEVRYKYSSPTRFTAWIDGVLIDDISNPVSPASGIDTIWFGLINMSAQGSGFNLTEWIDNYTISTSRAYPSCLVKISNSPTWGAGTIVTQAPTTLSETSVAITADLTGLGTGPYWLWVVDNRQAHTSGYQLGESAGSAPVAAFTRVPSSGMFPLSVAFDSTGTTNTPTSWAWDFDNNGVTDSTAQNPTYIYNAAGVFTVQLTATNAYGSDTETATVTVTTPPPAGQGGTLLFSEGFEDTNYTTGTVWYDGVGYPVATDHRPGSTGTRCVNLTWDTGDAAPNDVNGVGAGTIRKAFTASEEIYVSYWVKHSANWTGSNLSYHPHIFEIVSNLDYAADDGGGIACNYTNFYIEENEGVPRLALQDGLNITSNHSVGCNTETRPVNGCAADCDNIGIGACGNCSECPDGTCNARFFDGPSDVFTGDTTWRHVEARLKMNTISGSVGQPDGIIQYWLDDVLVVNQIGVIIRTNQHATMTLQEFVFAPWIGNGSPVTQSMYIDDLEVWDGVPDITNDPPPPTSVPTIGVGGFRTW